ncbi:unnamed protein product [Mytilus coruscus]|uniref:Uncharacterized protein n=1 Tax=Mytilus coruscus TaxID=42192 RepID=A0A6J8ERU2_MYTCO|nr:unnamed protein product [Mytilus coruscus]
MTTIVPPSRGFDKLPPVKEVSDGADVARIKYYRNVMAHAEKDELSNEDFNTMWICVSEAIIRLGGIAYKSKCEEVSQMNLNKDILGYIRQDLFEFREEICAQLKILTTETVKNRADISLLQAETSDIHNECSSQVANISLLSKNVVMQIRDLALELQRNEEETIPKNIRAQHKQYIDEWTTDDQIFVITNATKYVKSSLKYNNSIIVTGCSGNGKSSIIHHVALELHSKYGYEVIPFVTGPFDIINFRDPKKKQVFVVDDICGKEAISIRSVELWRDHLDKLEKIFNVLKIENDKKQDIVQPEFRKTPSPKILISCRLHIYRDLQFQLLKRFTRNECNLTLDDFRLLDNERILMMKQYLPVEMCDPWELEEFDFFPLICKLSKGKSSDEVKTLFTFPVDTIKDDLKRFISCQNKYQFCALGLCILFVDGFDPDWLKIEYSPFNKGKIQNIVDECKININLERPRKLLKQGFKTLESTYLRKRGHLYIMIHDKIHEIAAFLYGQDLTECFIKYAPMQFVCDHYRFESPETKEKENIIILPKYMRDEYINRVINDLKQGGIISAIRNKNLVIASFRAEIINILQQNLQLKAALIDPFTYTSYHKYNKYTTPLMEATIQGFLDLVEVLIDIKCNVNGINYLGKSPLFMACEGGHIAIAKLLLQNDANVCICDYKRMSLLHVSCFKGHVGIVRLLLSKRSKIVKKRKISIYDSTKAVEGDAAYNMYNRFIKQTVTVNVSQIDFQDYQGRSPLYFACKGGHTHIVKLLLELNADVTKCNKRGHSPLILACKGGYTNIVKLLLGKRANVNKQSMDGRTALHFACKRGSLLIVKILLENQANISQGGWSLQSPLYEACEGGQIEVVKLLLKKNADVNQCGKFGQTPLIVACKAGRQNITKVLLENEADIFKCDKFGKSPLYMACKTGNTDVVQTLLENGADVNQCDRRKQSPLFVACKEGFLDIVELLLKTKPSLDKRDVHGQAPLHIASEGGHTNIVKCLLNKGANVNQRGRAGQTPVYFACCKGHIDVAEVLLINRANVLLRNKYNRSPLHGACEMGHIQIARLLLENGAKVLNRDKFGTTLLHTACKGGHDELVKLLLRKNADVNQCDNNGQSALHIACKGNNRENDYLELNTCDERYREIVKVLLEMNADVTLCDNQGITPLSVAHVSENMEIVHLIQSKQ